MTLHSSGRWTPEEDELLRRLIERYQGAPVSWMDVARAMKRARGSSASNAGRGVSGRPQGHWKRVEDDMLYLIMWPSTSCENWDEVAQWMEAYLPSCHRSAKACRDRWCNYLSPDILTAPFTPEEIAKIAELLPISKSWASLARHLPGRPARLIKEECRKLRWDRLMSPGRPQRESTNHTPSFLDDDWFHTQFLDGDFVELK
ncbi:hypothetical protein SPRG_11254 [Saprolegnia parasitica CBS 223.65]|uniref:Myb-like domain-containing protein n=1 Tax=Saprolegnia parasitica (strain CBS 223.65) TaxID=695850 RepID=A0A067CAI3_SAPPC|nr:hypothetical protein SPRG_11254 [Saprolegnia parasitica CBS 223.65]KDO23822.1 hypothetical protein SPRG_11254 [Saprolegnia parasitica CBS 223.65]|eukprot:XP_012205455.1 hypothetical protein SPRG_11254 [Saprolegnia parasitica CBS 223.65]